uniref:Macro domain-containing protein n=1 Tax=Biomphalaria glabrata TaxID=6526 RepID=A0A2C9JUQ2_BIOGL
MPIADQHYFKTKSFVSCELAEVDFRVARVSAAFGRLQGQSYSQKQKLQLQPLKKQKLQLLLLKKQKLQLLLLKKQKLQLLLLKKQKLQLLLIEETKTSTPAVEETKTSTPAVEETKTSTPAVEETKTSTPAVEETKTSTPAIVETTAPNHAIQEKAGANQAVEKATHLYKGSGTGGVQIDVNESDVNESDVNESDVNESDVNESDVSESDANESDVNESDANESDVNESDANESDVNENDVNESDANESDVNRTKINVSEVQVKFFGIQEFLRSYEGQNLLKSIENGNRCIIQLKSDADKKVESLTSVSNQKTSLEIILISRSHFQLCIKTLDTGIKYTTQSNWNFGNMKVNLIVGEINHENITGLVIKILKEAEKMKLGSISMPAIGTGILGYQLDVAASALLEGIRLFSQSHRVTLIKLINIVIFPTDVEIAQTFRSILFRQDDMVGESKQVGLNFTDPSKDQSVAVNGLSQEVDLQIFSDNANKRRVAEQVLQEECLSAFKIEVDKDKNLQHLKPDQIKELENIGLRYGIKVGIESDQLTMQGFRSDGMLQVQRAKEKLILEAVGQHHRSLLTVMQSSIEWQYKKKNRWVSFTPLLNSELEKARKDSTTFKHVDVSGTKYNFNFAAKRVLVEKGERQTTLEIRRFDKTKDGEPLPRHWKAMSETENLKLVEIRPGSVEYDNVEAHFKLTCGGYPVKKPMKSLTTEVLPSTRSEVFLL